MSIEVLTLKDRIKPSPTADSTLATQEYFVNMGPQHPSTHGVLRLVLKLDGETICEVIPVLGYIHRGIEKIGENLNYRQFVHLTDRMDYLSSLMNNWAVSRAVELAAGIETNERIETIRTILAELQRIQSHLLWWSVFAIDLGAITPFLYGFRDREMLTEILEETIGARLTMNYIQPGGLMNELHPNFVRRIKAYLEYLKPRIDEYDDLVSGNMIIQKRTKDIGCLTQDAAVALGATGPVLRATGLPYDLRKIEPYGVYNKVKFSTALGQKGDSWDRYWVRIEEMRQSIHIVEQLIEVIPEGKFTMIKPASKIRCPEGQYYSHIETARGVLGVFIVSRGGEKPYRIHMRSPSFHNIWCLTQMAPGHKIADLVAMMSTLDLVIPDMDR